MLVSMTGFGRAEAEFGGKKYFIEIRTVNNRFCEISFKYPKYLYTRDVELKEIVKKKISRGKISVLINLENTEGNGYNGYIINKDNVKDYLNILKSIRKSIGSKEKIKLDHILHFTDILTTDKENDVSDEEFKFICDLMNKALDDLIIMKTKEGDYLKEDLFRRIDFIEKDTLEISLINSERIPAERERLAEKVTNLLTDKTVLDDKRLELEIILLTEKIDITEECTRLRSHLAYFKDSALSSDHSGRRLNFLIQEMNREINTIASKSMDAEISQRGTVLKEELEKIREQIQNIE